MPNRASAIGAQIVAGDDAGRHERRVADVQQREAGEGGSDGDPTVALAERREALVERGGRNHHGVAPVRVADRFRM